MWRFLKGEWWLRGLMDKYLNKMEIHIEENVELEPILIDIGFLPVPGGLEYDFGNCMVKATKTYKWFNEIFQFYGTYFTSRSAGEIEFDLPLKVESYEQGVALLAKYIRSKDFLHIPEWINQGKVWENHLPGRREMKAYRDNPTAYIEHGWFRVLLKKIIEAAHEANDQEITTISYDGSILRVEYRENLLVCPGIGKAWTAKAILKTKSLGSISTRISRNGISIYLWKGALYIGNRVFQPESLVEIK